MADEEWNEALKRFDERTVKWRAKAKEQDAEAQDEIRELGVYPSPMQLGCVPEGLHTVIDKLTALVRRHTSVAPSLDKGRPGGSRGRK